MKLPNKIEFLWQKDLNVQIFVNGEPREAPADLSIADLLVALKLEPRYLAVERNRELVPRKHHAICRLGDGDQLEIVTLVGGG